MSNLSNIIIEWEPILVDVVLDLSNIIIEWEPILVDVVLDLFANWSWNEGQAGSDVFTDTPINM